MTNDSRELTHAEMQTVYEQNLKDFQRLQRKTQVLEILNEMDVPDMRKDLNKIGNLRWLQRNLLIRNGNHPRAVEVVETITKMARDKNKENQQVMKLPVIPGGQRMNVQVGDIIGFVCDYKHTKIEGQVLRILEKVNGLRPQIVTGKQVVS